MQYEPTCNDIMTVHGVKGDGSTEPIAKAYISPEMKARDLCADVYGHAALEDEGSEGDMALYICNQLLAYMQHIGAYDQSKVPFIIQEK